MLRFFDSRRWGRYLDKRGKERETAKKWTRRTSLSDSAHRLSYGWLNQAGWDGWHVARGTVGGREGEKKICVGFCWWNLQEWRDNWNDLGTDGTTAVRTNCIWKRSNWKAQSGFICLGTETGGGLLWKRWWTFGLKKLGSFQKLN